MIPRQGVETSDFYLHTTCHSSAQVIPRQGVETQPENEYRQFFYSAQVIPRQGVETHFVKSTGMDILLSTGDSPTGGGNSFFSFLRISSLSTGDSPTGGGNTLTIFGYPRRISAQVIPRQGVETHLSVHHNNFLLLSTGDSPTGGGNEYPPRHYPFRCLSTGDSPTGGGNIPPPNPS